MTYQLKKQDSLLVLGLDIGQENDPVSGILLEREWSDSHRNWRFDLRDLFQLPLGTKYPQVLEYIQAYCGSQVLFHVPQLAVDRGGVGRAVVDHLRDVGILQDNIWGLITFSGKEMSRKPGMNFSVPKQELVNAGTMALQQRRLFIHPNVQGIDKLVAQLVGFEARKTTKGNLEYGNDAKAKHDDLVMALLMALWLGNWLGDVGGQEGGTGAAFSPYQISPGNDVSCRHGSGQTIPGWRQHPSARFGR